MKWNEIKHFRESLYVWDVHPAFAYPVNMSQVKIMGTGGHGFWHVSQRLWRQTERLVI